MKLTRILLLAVPALMLGVTACNPEEGEGGGGGTTATIPTEEGKTTLYFNLTSEDNVLTNDYTTIWGTGGYNGWKTGAESTEFKPVSEGSSTWYAIVDTWDTTAEQGLEIMLMLGYKADLLNPGLIWSNGDQYKAAGYDIPGGPNMTFTVEDGKANLGDISFNAELPEPVENIMFTPKITFKDTLPDYVNVYLKGTFTNVDGVSGWDFTQDMAYCKTMDHKSFTLSQAVYARPDSEVVIHILLTNAAPVEGEAITDYTYSYKFDSREGENGNAPSVTVTLEDNNKIVTLADALEVKLPPDPSSATVTSITGNITKVEGATLPADTKYYVVGGYNEWGNPTVELTETATGYTFTIDEEDMTSTIYVGGSVEIKLVQVDAETGAPIWDTAIGVEGGGNYKVTCDVATPTASIELYTVTPAEGDAYLCLR